MKSIFPVLCAASLNLVLVACGGGGSSRDAAVQSDAAGQPDVSARACAPSASCHASPTCLGLADNATANPFGLRVSQLSIMMPAALGTGLISTAVQGAISPNLPLCNESGTATANILLQFDTTANTLTLGAAPAVADPTNTSTGYSFVRSTVGGISVQPASMAVTIDGSGMFATSNTTPASVPLALYLDAAATRAVVLPLSAVSVAGRLSTDHDCIGSYNSSTLDPANSCQPDSTHPQFTTGGTISGYISLVDADSVVIAVTGQTLCVQLSGNPTMYGDGVSPVAHCKRDASGAIEFQGDWCAATNAAAAAGCADALQFTSAFAASAATIH